jgi:hypothetical protein
MAVVLRYKSVIVDYWLVSLEVEVAVILSYKSVIVDYWLVSLEVEVVVTLELQVQLSVLV